MNLFFGSFRKADADDPETFTAGCLRLFTAYPPEAVQYVVDPLTGLPGQSEWLPTLAKVKAALDSRAFTIAQAAEREERIARQLAERKQAEEAVKRKPTFEELKAKYGPNWGLKTESEDEQRAKRREALNLANRRTFEAECDAAGIPRDSQVSPTLRALIGGR